MRLIYAAAALQDLEALSRSVQERVLDKIDFYARHEDPLRFARHLTGYNAYRFRIGIYRVLFEVHYDTIIVLKVMKRDKAYKEL